jgi:hypothetical protein
MAKANFDHIYTAPDPRPYFQTLGALDYQIPSHGAAVFGAVAEQVAEVRDQDTVHIADLCCSYGINAAVMKHEATYAEVVEHYTTEDCQGLDRHELLQRDREFFGDRQAGQALEVVGIDVSAEAIEYAVEAGFLDGGAAEDLETRDPSPELVDLLESTDLVTVTGGIGYITERTVERVLDAAPTTPWMAALCLRWVDFDDVAAAGRARDMVVHRLEDVTFPQRRFADAHEQEHVLKELSRRGVDATGREEEGYHHAELFVLHPADEALTVPLHELALSAEVSV